MTTEQKAITPYNRFKDMVNRDDVQERFRQMLEDRAPTFLASLLSLVSADDKLLSCDPTSIFAAAAKAAILRLPIAKELGFAWIVPYGSKAEFVAGYKGLVQLAIRTSQYEAINATEIYEGMEIKQDPLTGMVRLNGARTGDEIIAYASYFKLKNGFEKFLVMTVDEIHAHAKRYSKSYGNNKSAWSTNFHEMAKKTVLRLLLSKWGLMSIEMLDADVSETPAIGDDPRLAMPKFEEMDNPLEGSFKDVDPEPETQPSEPEQPPAEPEQSTEELSLADKIVEAGHAENVYNANALIQLLKLDVDSEEDALAKAKGYRAWRDMGADSKKAAGLILKGEYPKE